MNMTNYQKGNIFLIILLLLLIVAVAIGGFLSWQKRCGAWPFEDYNVRCELGQRIVSNKVFQKTLTWEECIKVPGAMIMEMYPAKCSTPDGGSAVQSLSDEEKKKLESPHEEVTDETKNWNLYESASGGFFIKYPPEYLVAGGTTQLSLTKSGQSILIKWGKALQEPKNVSMFGRRIDSQAGIIHLAEFSSKDGLTTEWKSNSLMLKGGDYYTDPEMKYLFSANFKTGNLDEINKIFSTFKFIDQNSSGKTSGACSKDKDCAAGYKCWVPNCDAVKDLPGGDDCYITAPSCTKAY